MAVDHGSELNAIVSISRLLFHLVTGLPQTQSESVFNFVVFLFFVFFFFFIFFRVGKSLACHSPAKWCL